MVLGTGSHDYYFIIRNTRNVVIIVGLRLNDIPRGIFVTQHHIIVIIIIIIVTIRPIVRDGYTSH